MTLLRKIPVTRGVYFVEAPEAGLRILCGCPADSVKHLMKRGLILPEETDGVAHQTGPNAILLSDVLIQGGQFANLAEFPVLQMLYFQGMILPGHPNNTGVKPLLIGSDGQVDAQMEYIYRGNYGLLSEEELVAAGADEDFARQWMRLKLRFAFGKIQQTSELLDACVVGSGRTEVRNGLFIQRLAMNVFEFTYKDATVTVDLNLPPGTSYEPPYYLGHSQVGREYFAVVHSGEGDGWDINRPCMSSILMYQGHIYLIDAGPNILYSLHSLGIGVNEIEGIFHTHAHDDHFCGLTTLIRADHKLKYYATPLVRASVTKKLCALVSIDESEFAHYFDIHDLTEGTWNDLDGLEVMPLNSPHPVETTIFQFRTLGPDGYRTYGHFADIVSMKVLGGFVTDDETVPGVDQAYFDKTRAEYLQRLDVKKLDIGGGLIHGDAEDFATDQTDKIILSHTSNALSPRQRELGSGAPFGMVDTLVQSYQNYFRRYAFHYLAAYFPTVERSRLFTLTNNAVETFNPESILLKAGEVTREVYLVLTGDVEMICTESGVNSTLSAGAIVGEFSGLMGTESTETFRALNFVRVLRIPRGLYVRFIETNALLGEIERLHDNRDFLMKTSLFGEGISFPVLNRLAAELEERHAPAGQMCGQDETPGICLVKSGLLRCLVDERVIDQVLPDDFVGGTSVLYNAPCVFQVQAVEDSELFHLPAELLREIPIVRWKLFETHKRRTDLALNPANAGGGFFEWRQEYEMGVEEMDGDHSRMFALADELLGAIKLGSAPEACRRLFDAMTDFSREHFTREEALMQANAYPDAEAHANSHKRLLLRVESYRNRLEAGEIHFDMDFMSLVKDWIINHILAEDRRLGAFCRNESPDGTCLPDEAGA